MGRCYCLAFRPSFVFVKFSRVPSVVKVNQLNDKCHQLRLCEPVKEGESLGIPLEHDIKKWGHSVLNIFFTHGK